MATASGTAHVADPTTTAVENEMAATPGTAEVAKVAEEVVEEDSNNEYDGADRKPLILRLCNLPPNTTYPMLFDALEAQGPFGRVYSAFISHDDDEWYAEVSFIADTLDAGYYATMLLIALASSWGFFIDGRQIHIEETPGPKQLERCFRDKSSRVILLYGPPELVSIQSITAYLNYPWILNQETDRILEGDWPSPLWVSGRWTGRWLRCVEWRFTSYPGARKAALLLGPLVTGGTGVKLRWGSDPCGGAPVVIT